MYDGESIDIGKRAVVIGGGFRGRRGADGGPSGAEEYLSHTAAQKTKCLLLRRNHEAEAEGVKIMYLVAPYSIVAENKVVAINMCNQVLGEK